MIQMDTMAMAAEIINITVQSVTMMVFGMKNSELLVGEPAALVKVKN